MAKAMLREKFKTFEGASKRARYENSLAPFEFSRGYKARLYVYRVVLVDGVYRITREIKGAAK